MNIHELFEDKAQKQRLDPKCWTGYHKAGTKVKGGVRVNNCVPNEGIEVVSEFAPGSGDDNGPDEEEILFRLAKQWWLGTEQDMIRTERTLASMGWEIGEDEGYDEGGVFVVRAGDVNGKSYVSWSHNDLASDELNEFAPGGGGGSGDYLRALASAWYNGVFNTGSLPKGIKSQEDVERLLNRGIVCPDGKTRKLHIDYNSDFDGVVIYSDDYYEHGDESGELDSRTGQPFGPYDHMEFAGDELDEGVAEGWTKLPSGDYQNSHTGVRTSKPPVKKKRGEKTGAEWDAIKAKKEQGVAEGTLDEKSVSKAQFRTMAAAAHNPEFAKKVGIKQSVAKEFHKADKKSSYKSLPKVAEGRGDYVPPKEADYGPEYQAMVQRVGQKARQQELAKQKQKQKDKKEDSNMPVAVDSTSPIHGFGEDADGVDTKHVSPASQKLIQKARQASPDARSDLDAVFSYLDDVARRTQDNYGKVNDILRQLDPLSTDLDRTEQELANVRQVNQGQQQLLARLKNRLDKGTADTAQAQQQQQANKDAAERDAINKQLDQTPSQAPAAPVVIAPGTDSNTKQQIDKLSNRLTAIDARTYKNDTKHMAKMAAAQGAGKMLPKATHDAAAEIASDTKPFDLNKLNAIKQGIKGGAQNEEITEDIYESRLYKMKLAGYFD